MRGIVLSGGGLRLHVLYIKKSNSGAFCFCDVKGETAVSGCKAGEMPNLTVSDCSMGKPRHTRTNGRGLSSWGSLAIIFSVLCIIFICFLISCLLVYLASGNGEGKREGKVLCDEIT